MIECLKYLFDNFDKLTDEENIYLSSIIDQLINKQVELDELMSGIKDSVEAIYKYKNSAMGIMEAISTDYSNLDFNASEIQSKLADPENMNFLKDVLSKLG